MSPIIRECERLKLDYFILHTGQHYSYNMAQVFFEQLKLPDTKYNLNVGCGSHVRSLRLNYILTRIVECLESKVR